MCFSQLAEPAAGSPRMIDLAFVSAIHRQESSARVTTMLLTIFQ